VFSLQGERRTTYSISVQIPFCSLTFVRAEMAQARPDMCFRGYGQQSTVKRGRMGRMISSASSGRRVVLASIAPVKRYCASRRKCDEF